MSDDAATFQVNIAESSPPLDVCRIFQRMSRSVVGITLESLDRTIEGGSMLAPSSGTPWVSRSVIAVTRLFGRPHNRVGTVTDLLEQNVELESVQDLAGHADPRTIRLYDRRRRKVTRNIAERISIKGLNGPD